MFFVSHINTARQLLAAYNGDEPFHLYIKKYFKSQPKHGSRDRKAISQLCYSAFRLGKALQDRPLEEQLLTGYFLCNKESSKLLEQLKPEWVELIGKPVTEKIDLLKLDIDSIFPWQGEFSHTIESESFILSHLQQPLLFLRVRPGKEKKVKEKLSSIPHEWLSAGTIALENSTRIQDVLRINDEVVVQDMSSQEVGQVLREANLPASARVWDCCAASGGKSILVSDIFPSIKLTASDVRPGILSNLKDRLREAGVRVGEMMVIDLLDEDAKMPAGKFDLLIADVPCSGSGTWGRTPEQLYYFDPKQIDIYADKQSRIMNRVAEYVKPGGWLLYCTCSIFKKENEGQVSQFLEGQPFVLEQHQLIKGYNRRSDSLFAALLRKTS